MVFELIKTCASGLVMEDPATKVKTAKELFAHLKKLGTVHVHMCSSV